MGLGGQCGHFHIGYCGEEPSPGRGLSEVCGCVGVCLLCWLAVRASVLSAQELEFTLRAKGLDILLKLSVGLCVAGV